MKNLSKTIVLLVLGTMTMWSCEKEDNVTPQDDSTGSSDIEMEYRDLGLSVKWATCNIGASKPEEYGNYYAWGETETKSRFNWDNYKFFDGYDGHDIDGEFVYHISKYCLDSEDGIVDNKTTLEKSDDVAYTTLGGKWRIPTQAEWQELIDNCYWVWGQKNGVDGYYVIAKSANPYDLYGNYVILDENSIFLPACGQYADSKLRNEGIGYYWASDLFVYSYDRGNTSVAADLCDSWRDFSYATQRCSGVTVRAILEE